MRLLPAFPTSAILVASLAIAVTLAPAQTPASRQSSPAAIDYGKLPISFEANQGQTDPAVQFLAHGQGYTFLLSPGDAALSLRAAAPASTGERTSLIRLHLAGADAHAVPQNEDPQITKTNYFIGNNPAKWHTNISNYGRVRYRSVYPGIDLVYYGNQRQLEHDFIVAPQADPSAIQISIAGTQTLRIDKPTGDLILTTPAGTVRLLKPVTYQQQDGERRLIPSTYKLLSKNRIGFSVGPYDRSQSLVIDPVLLYSTYLGGSGRAVPANGVKGDQGNAITIGADGSAYLTGSTYSYDFPVTSGVYQTVNHATANSFTSNVFVSRLNPSGSALLTSTYLGGSGFEGDAGNAIALDSDGNIYIGGSTASADFPVTSGAYQTTMPDLGPYGSPTGFVAKLSPDAASLLYSTYLGGPNNSGVVDASQVNGIAVNTAGNAYVTGPTASTDFPTTTGAFQTTAAYGGGAFVTELSADGSSLVYSTYVGSGESPSDAYSYPGVISNAIAIDSAGNAYITGISTVGVPVTANAYQSSPNGIAAFFIKLDPSGKHELYGTYLGGSNLAGACSQVDNSCGDSGNSIAVDNAGNAYIAGTTQSTSFPELNPLGELFPTGPASSGFGTSSAFAAKFETTPSTGLKYATLLAGDNSTGTAIAIDSTGNAYVAGSATTGYFYPSTDALTPAQSFGQNAPFVAKISPIGQSLLYASLFGGTSSDVAHGIAVDSAGNAYITGSTSSTDFNVTSNAYQQQNHSPGAGSSSNAFVTAFALGTETTSQYYVYLLNSASATQILQGQPITITTNAASFYGSAPTGTVTLEGLAPLAAPTITLTKTSGGGSIATWTSSSLPPGHYTVYANYSGDSTHLASTAPRFTTTFTVLGTAASISLPFVAPSNITYNRTTTYPISVRVFDSLGDPLAGVTVTFSGTGFGFSSPTAVTGSDGTASVNFTTLQAGSLTLTASVIGTPATLAVPINVLPAPLLVDLYSCSRYYGSPNPSCGYGIRFLQSGDAITVTTQSTATQTSPLGIYPITATVTGAALSNYTLTVTDGKLSVVPALLTVWASPATQGSNYGSPIALSSGFTLTGFVNGDTQATAVTGAPTQTTTATSTSPAGSYPINQSIGTLAATNYTFNFRGGLYYIYDVTLNLTATSFTIAQGQPIPTLTFSLTGFVNGDTKATAVTGAPSLSTTATSTSSPGTYPIVITQGSLASGHYRFHPINGTLTITPPPTLTFSPPSITFPPTSVNTTATTVLTVNNTSAYAASVSSYTFSGANAGEFSIQSKSCVTTLAANSSCTLTIAFKPTATGSATASFIATDSAAGSPQSVPLTGTGN